MKRRHNPSCLDEDGVLDHCVCGLDLETELFYEPGTEGQRVYDPDDRFDREPEPE